MSSAAIAAFAALLPATGGHAAESDRAAGAEASSITIEAVVVTARKRAENENDVPISLQAISGDNLVERNIGRLEDLTPYVPNFSQAEGASGSYRFIRGAGSGNNVGFEQTVGIFVDNVYQGRGPQGRMPFYDLEQLEVLRGPQVLVFGNSTTAGAINITTRKPGGSFEADGSASYEGVNQEFIIRGGITIPLSDTLSVRLAGMDQNLQHGWLKDTTTGLSAPGMSNFAGRATAVYKPDDDLTLTLKYERAHVDNDGSTLQPIHQNAFGGPGQPPGPLYPEVSFDHQNAGSNAGAPLSDTDFAHLYSETFQGDIHYTIFGGTLVSTTAFSSYRFIQSLEGDLLPAPALNFSQNEHYRQFSQELRFDGHWDALDYTLGGYYQDDRVQAFSVTDTNLSALGAPFPPFGRVSTFDQNTRSWSGFVNLTYHMTAALQIEAGARYAETRKTADQAVNLSTTIPGFSDATTLAIATTHIVPPGGPLAGPYSAVFGNAHTFTGLKLAESHFQPQVAVQYNIDPSVMLYAKWVKGAKAGGFDWLSAQADASLANFKPEEATSLELGGKGLFFADTLDVDLTLFKSNFKNLQVTSFNGSTNFFVTNAAASRAQGLEAEIEWRPIERFTINASGAYLDSIYKSFPAAGCFFEETLLVVAPAVCSQNLSGTPTPYASKLSGTIGLEYVEPVGDYTMKGGVMVEARGSYNAGTTNDPVDLQKGYALLDAHFDLTPNYSWWTVSLFGKNLADKLYFTLASDTPGVKGARFATTPRGRELGIQLSAKF